MSSRASAKSPTPGSSSSSRNQPQSLAQEPANTEDFDMPDLKYDSDGDSSFTKESYDKLRRIIQKQEAETKDMQKIELQGEITTLRAAANIVTTPVYGGRQKLKLSAPVTYDGTPGTLQRIPNSVVHAATYLRGKALKWFKLIQEEYLKCKTLDECTTETRDIYANFKGFEDTLRSLFQDPDEKRQAERDLA
nr:reverse transcriptase domain protein [Colletotrichum truncatum]KAF6782640.1 reverse transcriptase domain protein [Colletotrichum truncatum]